MSEHRCPYPEAGCTSPGCPVSAMRAEQRAYERGHVVGYQKGVATLVALTEGDVEEMIAHTAERDDLIAALRRGLSEQGDA